MGALTEVIGWAGRTWSAVCPYNNNAFLMQISTLIIGKSNKSGRAKKLKQPTTNHIAPTFFTAGIYVVLGRLISLQGPHTSPISPKMYLWIFCTCDLISLVVQAVGGGLASDASSTAGGDTKPGTDIMVAGILFQMASIVAFTVLGVNFLISARNDVFPLKLKLLVATTSLSVMMIFARSVYRSIELLQGWSGFLILHEGYFIALDGALMVVAVGCFNLFHPSWLLERDKDQDVRDFSMEPSLKDSTVGDE